MIKIQKDFNFVFVAKRNLKKIRKYDALPNFKYEKEEKYYYKEQVKGIIWNHFKDEDYKWLRQNVNI